MPKGQPVRLYAKAAFVGFKRAKANQYSSIALAKIEGVRTKEDTNFYLGKRVAYVYRCKRTQGIEKATDRVRVMWGRVRRAHGNTGSVRVSFKRNLPPAAMGARLRVMMYPSSI
eukprot:gnl/Hemi2/3034_TR1072_c0_g1_i1.p2 gnl/Hemi2/3034_TR1072_c0_g1~~gnl/Hemi2/3034_TR1072_c0_g1_i1.p2  ORF type:complete len:127 (+),score=54.44 gnl/Hemi2/3034_TR1072_c0_g1_i1:41-382(+)